MGCYPVLRANLVLRNGKKDLDHYLPCKREVQPFLFFFRRCKADLSVLALRLRTTHLKCPRFPFVFAGYGKYKIGIFVMLRTKSTLVAGPLRDTEQESDDLVGPSSASCIFLFGC